LGFLAFPAGDRLFGASKMFDSAGEVVTVPEKMNDNSFITEITSV